MVPDKQKARAQEDGHVAHHEHDKLAWTPDRYNSVCELRLKK
jgi:hypothetical protein